MRDKLYLALIWAALKVKPGPLNLRRGDRLTLLSYVAKLQLRAEALGVARMADVAETVARLLNEEITELERAMASIKPAPPDVKWTNEKGQDCTLHYTHHAGCSQDFI